MGICASDPNEARDAERRNTFLAFQNFFPDFVARFSSGKSFKLEKNVDNITFRDLLKDETLWEEFSVFVTEQIAEENVLFINDLLSLKDLHASPDITDSVKMLNQQFMVDEYLSLNSPMQLNIPSRMRAEILETYKRLRGEGKDHRDMKALVQRFASKGEKGSFFIQTHVGYGDIAYFLQPRNEVYSLLERNFMDSFREWYKDQRSCAKQKEVRDLTVKRIVVLGGGPCGVATIKLILKLHKETDPKIEIVLVDPKEYFQFRATMPWICLRSYEVGFDTFHKSTFMTYAQIFKDFPNVRVVQRKARAIRKDHVVVGYENISFDYLVVSTGSHYPSSIAPTSNTFAHRKKQLAFENKKLADAQRILLVGGGLVSVETAAELKWRFPDKQILVIHSHDKFLPRISGRLPDIHDQIVAYYDKLGIKYQLNTELLEKNPYTHQMRLKNKLTGKLSVVDGTDYHMFWCAAQIPNTQMFVGELAECLDTKHLVKCDPYFGVEGTENMFVGGDITNLKQEKCVVLALRHAPYIATNLLAKLRGKPEEMIAPTVAAMSHEDFLISMGPEMGINTGVSKDCVMKEHLVTKYMDHRMIFEMATMDPTHLLNLVSPEEKEQLDGIAKFDEAMTAFFDEHREQYEEMDLKHMERLKTQRKKYLQVDPDSSYF